MYVCVIESQRSKSALFLPTVEIAMRPNKFCRHDRQAGMEGGGGTMTTVNKTKLSIIRAEKFDGPLLITQ